jgi:putative cardiolipin synthase
MLMVLKYFFAFAVFLSFAIILARIVFAAPVATSRTNSLALPPPVSGPIADALSQRSKDHAGLTGIAPLQNGADAFAARMILADAAVSSIDAQYYIWHGDLTGYLLLDAMQRAAERGVRVRLLLDDNGTSGLDPELAALVAHPNVEVRLYNPFNLRRLKLLSYGFDFFRLNRRMHNKSFTVDGHVTILGGRNVGDEYFGTGATALFVDLDVLAVGGIVSDVSGDFDRYWAAPSVHPAGLIVGKSDGSDPIGAGLAQRQSDPQMSEYRDLLQKSDIVAALAEGRLELEWTTAVLVSDDPVKGEGAVPREDLLASRLLRAVGHIEAKFDGISPYFVPGKAGTRAFGVLQKSGVSVRMLTNSLEATDVLPVHAGYAKRRKALLRSGVGLYELRRTSAPNAPLDKMGPFGSSGASLHAKTFAVDGERIFVGSFNFDPRSTTLNTEMGLLIDSPQMAQGLHDAFDRELSGMAWRIELKAGHPVWVDPVTAEATGDEPGSNIFKRAAIAVVGWLPVEWLL